MNTHTMHKIAISLILGGTLSVASHSVMAVVSQNPVQISQMPLSVGASGSPPNIMLMVDDSGSMDTSFTVTNTPVPTPNSMPASFTYSCGTPVANGAATSVAVTTLTTMRVSSNSPAFCASSSSCGSSSRTNFSNSKCFDNNLYYKISNFSDGSTLGPFKGINLNWYFSTQSFTTGSLLVSSTTTWTRIAMAQAAANNLVTSLTPAPGENVKVRMGLAAYNQTDSTKGGALFVPISDLNTTQATAITNAVNGLVANDVTPLSTTLMTIGRYFTTGYTGSLTLHPNATPPGGTNTINNIFNGLSIQNKTGLSAIPSTPPIQNYCQKNAVILISDGLPNFDREVGSILADYTGDCGTAHKCDSTSDTAYNISFPGPTTPTTGPSTGPTSCSNNTSNNVACKNGSKTGRAYESGGSDYLDDIAAALYDMDMRPDLRAAHPTSAKQNISTYTIGIADPNVKAQVKPSNGGTGNENVGTVLEDAAAKGGGSFVFADNYQQLAAALDKMVANIRKGVGSFSTIAANSSQLTAGTALFLASYDTADWTGDLSAIPLDPTTGNALSASWNAGTKIVPPLIAATTVPATTLSTTLTEWKDRNLFTYNTTAKGIGFKAQAASTICGLLTTSQQTALGMSSATSSAACAGTTTADQQGLWRLDFLRGDISHEVVNTSLGYKNTAGITDPRLINNTATNRIFRNRVRYRQSDSASGVTPTYKAGDVWQDPWLLGDIVNSGVLFVGTQDYGYAKATGLTATETSSYAAFVGTPATTTPSAPATGKNLWKPMVYIGANDGFLHGFDATVTGGGSEILAYMPNSIFSANGGLINLSSPTYNHQYFVDGTPRATDVYFGGIWHTVMVGTTGAGGSGIFALDVSDPTTFSASDVLWEISSKDTPNSADAAKFTANLGYSLPQVSIGRMNDGSWAAIVANGYVSANNKAALYILNIQTGAIIAAFDTFDTTGSATAANGLSTPFAADIDANGTIDAVYAGDLLGNMWKFDVSSSNKSSWKVTGTTPTPLFTACLDGTSTATCDASRQPITNKPQVGSVGSSQSSGGVMVYFGTGKYFEDTDNNVANTQTQTFYGVWDQCPLVSPPTGVPTSTTSKSSANVCNTSVPSPKRTTPPNTPAPVGTLVQQSIVVQTTSTPFVRGTSSNTIDWTTQKGWFMDFINPNTNLNGGERIVSGSLLRDGRIIFSTIIPIPTDTPDVCSKSSSSTSWVMVLDAVTGGSPTNQALGTQMVTVNGKSVPVSGQQTAGGSMGTPTIITTPPGGGQINGGNSSGGTEKMDYTPSSASSSGAGRQSWRQL